MISLIDDRGYPYSIISKFDLKETEGYLEILKPKSLRQKLTPDQKACVIFHRFNDRIDWSSIEQIMLRGVVNERENKLIFTPQHVSGFSMKGVKDRVKFLLEGRSATSEYLRRKGMKKPDLGYKPDPAFWKTYNAEHA